MNRSPKLDREACNKLYVDEKVVIEIDSQSIKRNNKNNHIGLVKMSTNQTTFNDEDLVKKSFFLLMKSIMEQFQELHKH